MSSSYTVDGPPKYLNFTDVDFRVAVNRHLPDNSQMWPDDLILCLQPQLFRRFLSRYFGSAEVMSQLKLFIGAYLVWYLSPFTSHYLTMEMMQDIGRPRSMITYVSVRCMERITSLMPLVVFKVAADRIAETELAGVFDIYRRVKHATVNMIKTKDEGIVDEVVKHLQTLSINAHNFSLSWDTVENAYEFIPDLKGNFFDIYLKAARASMTSFKASMRNPDNYIFHVPGLSLNNVYRLLVNRELSVRVGTAAPPMFRHDYPFAVNMAGLGVSFGDSLLRLIFFLYYMVCSLDQLCSLKNRTVLRRNVLRLFHDSACIYCIQLKCHSS